MTQQHGYIAHSGASTYAQALLSGGGDGGEYISAADAEPINVGIDLSSLQYYASLGFLSFDTSAYGSRPTSAVLTFGVYDAFGEPMADLLVAAWKWGPGSLQENPSTLGTGDWATPAQLAALPVLGRISGATVAALSIGDTFDIPIDPSSIDPAGNTGFILFTEDMRNAPVPPTGQNWVFLDGAGGTHPPVLTPDFTPVVAAVGSVSPPHGHHSGGSTVTIRGAGFATATDVVFGSSSAASFAVVDDATITATTPAVSDGTVHVTVVTPGGASPTSSLDEFSFDDLDSPPVPAPLDVINVTNIHGVIVKVLALAWVDTITRTKNQPRGAVVEFPKWAYSRDDVHVFANDSGTGDYHEIQIVRDGVVRFWGPAINATASSDSPKVTLDCKSSEWPLWLRFLDAQRTNLLDNPSLETGDLTGYTDNGAITSSVTSADAVRGTYSMLLESSTDLGDIYESQVHSVTATGVGTLLTVTSYFKIPSTLSGHALDRRGLYVEARESGDFKRNNFYAIDEATPIGDWIRASCTIAIPAFKTWDIETRWYSLPGGGGIRWDDSQLVAMQSISTASLTGSVTGRVDVAAIVGLILAHVQSTAVGKSDLNIDLDNPDTGVMQAKHIQWADHISWPDQMREWIDRGDCFDYSMAFGLESRTLTLHSPAQGNDYRGVVNLVFPLSAEGGNVVKYTFTEDGTSCITDDTESEQDTGSGPDREEGHYADASQIGGLVLQSVNSAPPGAEPSSLNPIARETVNKIRRPPATFVLTITDPDLIDLLDLGDVVDFAATDGWVTLSGFAHIGQLVEHPRNPSLDITLTKAVPIT